MTFDKNEFSLQNVRNLQWFCVKTFEYSETKGCRIGKKGDKERKVGNLERTIELFNIARYNGYNAPALYTSYAIIYRKLKDYNNEVAIIDEAIERLRSEKINVNQIHIRELKERRAKALALKLKQNNSER